MLRRVLVPALAVWIAWTACPAAASAQTSPRIVVLTVDGTSIEDWAAVDAFASLGSAGLLATRTATAGDDPVLLRAAAYTTLGAGAPAKLPTAGTATSAGRGVLPGALAEALRLRGRNAAAIGDASGFDVEDEAARLAVMRTDGTLASGRPNAGAGRSAAARTWRSDAASPGGRRIDYRSIRISLQVALERAHLVVVDLGDTVRADRLLWGVPRERAGWIARALVEADAFAKDVRAMLDPSDTLIVASLVPPLERVRAGVHLGAVAFAGSRGLPFSGTTRRPGVLALTDLGPTILDRAGVPVPEEMQGRPAEFAPSDAPLPEAAALDANFVLARRSRRPLTRIWVGAAAALAAAAFVTVGSGRGRAPGRRRLPRVPRDLIATGLTAAAAAPAALLVAPLLGHSVAAVGWWTLALATGAAMIARASLGVSNGLAAIALIDVALVAGDLLFGSPLAARSALGFQVAGGGRFYGIDEGLLGVMLGGSLVAAGAWADLRPRAGRAAAVAALPLGAIAVIAGSPALGSKFGAPFTLVPAFGVLVIIASGRRLDRAHAIGVGIATVLMSASLAAADALSAPAARSHIGRELAGDTPVGPLIARKISSFIEITGTTIWLPVAIVIAASVAGLLLRRRDLIARGFWGMPGRRAALLATGVGLAAAMVSNDTGIIVVTPALVIAAAAFYGPLLAPRRRSFPAASGE